MIDIKLLIFFIVLLCIIFLFKYINYNSKKVETNTKNKINKEFYELILSSIEITKIIYISNRNMDGYKYLTKINNTLNHLLIEYHIDFNQKNKIKSNILELKNLLLGLNSYKRNEDFIISEILNIITNEKNN